MEYTPITPFRRVMTAADLAVIEADAVALPPEGVNKWEVLRELGVARTVLGVSDRALGVLQALLSFHPPKILGGSSGEDLVVFPSNASICERLNGMPCSTMRRHLAALVAAGLIQRRDSPNGKRFVRRYRSGAETFGFDLSPLVRRFEEFRLEAEKLRVEREVLERQRRTVSLMRRDLSALSSYGAEVDPHAADWADYAALANDAGRLLRRKPTYQDLEEVAAKLCKTLDEVRGILEPEADELSTSDGEIEQQHQTSNIDDARREEHSSRTPTATLPPLPLVSATCLATADLLQMSIDRWQDVQDAAVKIYPMMGISQRTWTVAIESMGAKTASVSVLILLERFSEIRSPDAYLAHLTAQTVQGKFSCIAMLMQLAHRSSEKSSQL